MFNLNCKEEVDYIVKEIRNTFNIKKFNKAVIGISGGIDSAVIANLCVKALGKENVLGFQLPNGTQKDIKDSCLLCSHLGIFNERINIEPTVNSLIKDKDMTSVRKGNISARIRMIILYDMAAKYNALVVGTGNRTELLLGYFTLHGDGACALEPIGHLYKTEVRQLAKYLKIPKSIITKAPSAGLWEGQTDEKELGYKYEDIDKFLHCCYDEMISPEKLSSLPYGFTEKFMMNIVDKVDKNLFKLEPNVTFKRLSVGRF
uniref:Putative NAD+ synthase n=1 Tax=viral metagenome TaxID=1070528 RepID=A0A6M3KXE0_9ZZZZ